MPTTDESKALGAFIQRNHGDIIGEFAAFARTLMPHNSTMTDRRVTSARHELPRVF